MAWLRVEYEAETGIDEVVDSAIEAALAELGWSRWASGCNLVTGIRDLAFEREDKEEE